MTKIPKISTEYKIRSLLPDDGNLATLSVWVEKRSTFSQKQFLLQNFIKYFQLNLSDDIKSLLYNSDEDMGSIIIAEEILYNQYKTKNEDSNRW